MAERCECCRNFDSHAPVYSSKWKTGRVFQDQYSIHASNVIRKSGEGCSICSFLLDVLDLFLPNWRSKHDKLRLEVIAPDNRPFEVCVNEVPENPDALLRELVNIQFSNASSMLKHSSGSSVWCIELIHLCRSLHSGTSKPGNESNPCTEFR